MPLGWRARDGAGTLELGRELEPSPAFRRGTTLPELLVDFITSLDGCGSADGWPGWWGLEGPEYLAWLQQQPGDSTELLSGPPATTNPNASA